MSNPILENTLAQILTQENTTVSEFNYVVADFLNIFFAMQPHSGEFRHVFRPNVNLPTPIVIKVEYVRDSYQNMLEFATWKYISTRNDTISAFYAPCYYLSDNKKILIQRAVDRILTYNELETLSGFDVPASFIRDDPHRSNFGWIGEQLVCIDYGFADSLANINTGMIPVTDFVKKVLSKRK